MRNGAHLVWILGAIFIFASCSPNDATTTLEDASVTLSPDLVQRAITLRYQGKNEAAVWLLLKGTESPETAVEPLPCLRLTEAQFVKLQGDELESMTQMNMEVADSARALAREAMDVAAMTRDMGADAGAELWVQRVDAMGRELSKDNYNALLRLIGPSIIKTAARGLAPEVEDPPRRARQE